MKGEIEDSKRLKILLYTYDRFITVETSQQVFQKFHSRLQQHPVYINTCAIIYMRKRG